MNHPNIHRGYNAPCHSDASHNFQWVAIKLGILMIWSIILIEFENDPICSISLKVGEKK